MSIDEDLAKAIEEEPSGDRPPRTRRRRGAPTPKRNVGLLVGLIVIAVAVLALIPLTFQGSAVWATTVEQLVADESLQGRRVRVEGTLVRGTLLKRDEPCEYRFKLKTEAAVVEVRYPQCVIPDSLQDRPEATVNVTAEGKLGEDGVFEASQVLAKCPSKYEEKNGQMVPVGELELQ
jgi:cytochrome c-type biogenesis protein CcmE